MSSFEWPSTVVVLGSGPSVTREDVAYVQDRAFILAINDMWRWAPWCDHLHAADVAWWMRNPEALDLPCSKTTVDPLPNSPIPRLTAQVQAALPGLREHGVEALLETGETGYDHRPGTVRTGRNSGYQAIHLAMQRGARRVVLLGLDMTYAKDGRVHCHDHGNPRLGRNFAGWAPMFDTLREPLRGLGCEVINCSAITAITAFPKRSLREVL